MAASYRNERPAGNDGHAVNSRSVQARTHTARPAQSRSGGVRTAPSRSPGRGPQSKKKFSEILANPLAALAALALAVVLILLIRSCSESGPSAKYFCQGVSINGVDMSAFTYDEGKDKLISWADSVIGKSYTFSYGDSSFTFKPANVNARFNTAEVLEKAWNLGHTGSSSHRAAVQENLIDQPQDFPLTLSYDEALLDEFMETISSKVTIEPIDAEIVLTADMPKVVSESKEGLTLDTETFKDTLVILMTNGSSITAYSLPIITKDPSVSSDSATDGLQVIATCSTDLSTSSSARCNNVRLALNKFNGVVVHPGETLSFNTVVGKRSEIFGYQVATVYYGNSVTTGVGGGVCQASSTLYGALMKAGMTVVERHSHAMVVAYCPASQDAAVSEDASQDFIFRNDTDYNIYIYTNVVNKQQATVTVYGNLPDYRIELVSTILQDNIKNVGINLEPDYEGKYVTYTTEQVLKSEGRLGRKSKLERVYYDRDTGAVVKRETLSDDYYEGERDTYWVGVIKP